MTAFRKVAVLLGGRSAAREVSLVSGRACAKALRDEAEKLKDRVQGFVNSEQAGELSKQAEQLRDQFKIDNFKFDQKQMDELKQQMEEFRKNFKTDEFKFDRKQLDEWNKQMEQFRNSFDSESLQSDPV